MVYRFFFQEGVVKQHTVSQQRQFLLEGQEIRQHFPDGGCPLQICVPYSRQIDDPLFQAPPGIHKGRVGIRHPAVLHLDGADLDDMVGLRGQPGRLQIDAYEILHAQFSFPLSAAEITETEAAPVNRLRQR